MKKLLTFLLTLPMAAVFAGGCSAQSASEAASAEIILTVGSAYMLVNGSEQSIDDSGTVPIIINDRTFLPVRAIVEAMGGNAEWDGDSMEVTLTKGNDIIRLVIDSETAYLNDEPRTLDAAPVIINDRTMLPIRFIAEGFGFDVKWDAETQHVIIASVGGESTPKPSEIPREPEQPVTGENAEKQIIVTVNGQSFTATLEDNETARAFYDMLPMTVEMDELNGNEKYYYLDESLPSDSRRVESIRTGDLMLYGSNCIVSFFETFTTSYAYTPIGHIDDADGYAASLPGGSVTVTFSK